MLWGYYQLAKEYTVYRPPQVKKNPSANEGDIRDVGSIPGSGRSPGGGHGTNSTILAWRIPIDRGGWWATIHGVTKSRTQLK